MSSPQTHSSLRSVAAVTALTFVQLVLQFALQRVLATCFGAGSEMDALCAALNPPIVIAAMLSGSIGLVLIPVFAECRAAEGERRANLLATRMGLYLLAIAGATSAVVAVAAHPLTAALCPGFSSPQQQLTGNLLRLSAALILANCLVSLLNVLYQCWRRFAAPAAAGVAGTLATVIYVAFLHERQGIQAATLGILLGAALTAALLLPRWAPHVLDAEVWRPQSDPAVRRCLTLLLPLILGTMVARLSPLVDQYLASSLPEGSLAHLGFAWQLTSALMLLATSGLSIVAFPALAAHAAAGRGEALNAEIAHALRFLVVFIVPVTCGLLLFRVPVVKLLFEGGAFLPRDTQHVALLLALFLGFVGGATFNDLLSRGFYTLGDTRTPVVVGLLGFAITTLLKFLLVARVGAGSIALLTSLGYILSAATLAVILRGRLGARMFAGIPGCLARSVLATCVACLAALLVHGAFLAAPEAVAALAVLPAAVAGGATYVLCLLALRDEFALRLIGFMRRNGRSASPSPP